MKKLLNSILTILGGAFLCIVLAGCENFLNGADTKEQLEQLLKEANAPTVDIYMAAEKDAGNLSPNGIVSCKLERPFTVFFDPAKGVEFIRWEVVDRTTGELLTDVVTFDNPKSPETKAIITKEVKNIQIKPIYIEYPRVVSSSPEYSDYGSYANTSVRINFNVPMVYKFEDIHFSFDNITISSDGQNMSEYFNLPELSENKKTVSIKPKTDKLLSYMNAKNVETLEFVVSLDVSDIKVTVSDKNYAITETEETSFRYKIRNKTETNKPVKVPGTEVVVSREAFTASTVSSVTQKFPSGLISTEVGTAESTLTKQQVKDRRVLDSVYIYGKFKDDESGIQDIIVKEKRTNEQNGTPTSALWYEGEISEKQVNTDDQGNVEFCFKYTFRSVNTYGAFTLSIAPVDCADNVGNEELFTLFRIQKMDTTKIQPYNLYVVHYDGSGAIKVVDSENIYISDFDTELHTIKINDNSKSEAALKYPIYGEFYFEPEELTISYNFNKQGYKTVNHSSDGVWKFVLPDGSLNGKSLAIKVTDDLGNEIIKETSFPTKPVIAKIEKGTTLTSNGTDKGYEFSVTMVGNSSSTGAGVAKDLSTVSSEYSVYQCSNYNLPGQQWTAKCYLFSTKITAYYYMLNESLAGDLSAGYTAYTLGNASTTSQTIPSNKPLSITKVPRQIQDTSNGKTDVSVFINSDAWNYYDVIYLEYPDDYYGSGNKTIPIEKNRTHTSFTYNTDKLWNSNIPVNLYGLCSVEGSDGKITYTLYGPVTGTIASFGANDLYDNVIPTCRYPGCDAFVWVTDPDVDWDIISQNYCEDFYCADIMSGIKEIQWRIGDNGVEYSSIIDNDYFYTYEQWSTGNTYIPAYDMDEDTSKVYVKVIDNNNNFVSANFTKTFYNPPEFIPKNERTDGDYIKYDLMAACDPDEEWFKQKYKVFYYWPDDDLDDGDDSSWDSYYYAKWKKENTYGNSYYNDLKTNEEDGVKYYYYENVKFAKDTFYKIISFADMQKETTSQSSGEPCYYGITDPYYFYTGTPSSGDSTDSLVASSNIPSMYFVKSDQPVIVNTIITKKTLSECRNWTYEKWNHRHKVINDQYFNFSSSDRKIKSYTIDLTEIPYGYSYVVVAHFADGSVKMSEVRQMK